MKTSYLLLCIAAAALVACGKEAPPPAPAPKVEAAKPAEPPPRPPEAPSAAPASSGQDAKPAK